MMLRLAEYSGFCFGVRRAIQMTLDAGKEHARVCTLGEIIHNPRIVAQLSAKGIAVCDGTQVPNGDAIIIRSHGVTQHVFDKLQESQAKVVDATCPYVKRAQDLVKNMSAQGYPVLIMGDPNHPEVKGMLSYGDENTFVVEPGQHLPESQFARLCVVSQTTQTPHDLQSLISELVTRVNELRVFNTICLATTQRQFAAKALAENSDLMIVIGGKNSSNTRQLVQVCSSICLCLHIENADELNPDDVLHVERIGLTAGASTPADQILEVYNKIKEINGEEAVSDIAQIPLFKEESC